MSPPQEQSFLVCVNDNTFRAKTQDEEVLLDIIRRALTLRSQKNLDYGDAWRVLGSRGTFPTVLVKVLRLQKLLWEDREPQFESVHQNLFDLLNYVLHMILLFEEEQGRQDEITS